MSSNISNKFTGILSSFKSRRILVIGDIMLDKYVFGKVERISPEAPVPIVHAQKESYVPGGASNTANNMAVLGAKVDIVGFIGNDVPGRILHEELKKHGINGNGIFIEKNRPTIQKVRILGQSQQLLRIDYEKSHDISKETEQNMLNFIQKNISKADAVVVSDYAKGVITERIAKACVELSRKNNKPLVIDPRPEHKDFYRNCFIITPNQKEASEMVKMEAKTEDDILNIGKKLLKDLNCHVLLTRGEKGMTLFEKNGSITNIPTQAKEVYDVSGAGDTVVAALALSLSSKASLEESAIIANYAAGIVVGKIGTATVTQDELRHAMEKQSTKVKTLEEMKSIVDDLKKKHKKIVWTNGCFDILHVGHVKYLQEAKRLGDILILGLNSDESIKRLKGKNRPIVGEQERAEILSALTCIDYIIFFSADTPIKEIKTLLPDILAKGGDYAEDEIVGADVVKRNNGEVKVVPFIGEFSTTSIINKILATHQG